MNTTSRYEKPKLSVVVASQNAAGSIVECLRSIRNQINNGNVEILVIDNSTDGSAEIVKREFPMIKLSEVDNDKLIPELWGIGINESRGDYVALTTSHFVPAENWVSKVLFAHEQPYAGIGGAIENEERAGAVSWAVFFCRYSPYMLPFGECEVDDFAADNASYKRCNLEEVKDAMQDGFWETFVHKEMRRKGMVLLKSPEIIVRHQRSFTFSAFMFQRFWHGRQFSETRVINMPTYRRLAFVLLSPLIPIVYLFRITRRVISRRRNIDRFLWSLPILGLFLLSWSAGEFSGYLWSSRT